MLKLLNRNVEVYLQDLSMLDLGFGFFVKNCVYSRLETSTNPQCGQTITTFSFEQLFFLNSHQGLYAKQLIVVKQL